MLAKWIFVLFISQSLYSSSWADPCFNFSKQSQTLLPRAELAFRNKEVSSSATLPDGIGWAAIKGTVSRPISQVMKSLFDHSATKSPQAEMTVDLLKNPGYLAHHRVDLVIKPFPFVKIAWQEEWAYLLKQGTAMDPKEILISYQKTGGTSYIRHLCGSILVRTTEKGATEVFQYEETKATQHSAQDTLKELEKALDALKNAS